MPLVYKGTSKVIGKINNSKPRVDLASLAKGEILVNNEIISAPASMELISYTELIARINLKENIDTWVYAGTSSLFPKPSDLYTVKNQQYDEKTGLPLKLIIEHDNQDIEIEIITKTELEVRKSRDEVMQKNSEHPQSPNQIPLPQRRSPRTRRSSEHYSIFFSPPKTPELPISREKKQFDENSFLSTPIEPWNSNLYQEQETSFSSQFFDSTLTLNTSLLPTPTSSPKKKLMRSENYSPQLECSARRKVMKTIEEEDPFQALSLGNKSDSDIL